MPSEEAVFEAVISWIKQDEKKRKELLPKMLEFVRLPLLTPRYITDIVDSEVSKQITKHFFLLQMLIIVNLFTCSVDQFLVEYQHSCFNNLSVIVDQYKVM